MVLIRQVTLENFRCFQEKQSVNLAPLTLLIGENSTGKTSFLALLRALSEFVFAGRAPNFREPFDLGSFEQVAHYRGGSATRNRSFRLGLEAKASGAVFPLVSESEQDFEVQVDITFERDSRGSEPTPVEQQIAVGESWLHERTATRDRGYDLRIGTERGTWKLSGEAGEGHPNNLGAFRFYSMPRALQDALPGDETDMPRLVPVGQSSDFDDVDRKEINILARFGIYNPQLLYSTFAGFAQSQVFASGPVQSRPQRTYEPGTWEREPHGNHVPRRFAEMSLFQPDEWRAIKTQLETFGRASGLFDEIRIQPMMPSRSRRATGSDPFQLQVRKGSGRFKGIHRNIIDVGYGVSQVLPILSEVVAASEPTDLFLCQQPEVHLHPSAQAELGSLFCAVASADFQVVVETHSDHLLDRIRMDVRDERTGLSSSDVRILYFERRGLDVKIHELTWDEHGNIENAPSSYRRFFLEEVERSIWPPE
ncbi:MAG: AAA family ATPase [Chloroflexi bacterium]|nr:AAA family ATPase [Chloroflexota bacterium]MYI05458.1 AAA family ATPase [Chloroflexota bacterium]